MRTIAVVTVGRSDYGQYLPLLRRIHEDSSLDLHLIVAGMHLSPEYGSTYTDIEDDGFEISERVEMLLSLDTPGGIAKSMGLGMIGFAQAYGHIRPEILIVLGDRFEMHAAALAALPFKIPVAHLYGGELTQGAIDDTLRHCMTKLSHLHFVSTHDYAIRVRQLGEEPWRITVAGALALDNLLSVEIRKPEQLEAHYGFCLTPAPLLVTFHPVTLEYERTEWQIGELLAALEASNMPVVFTMPNADTTSRQIISAVDEFVHAHQESWLVDNLGMQDYLSLMSVAAAMVGNSSSGMLEAAPLGLPVVNVGTRQTGRIRTANIIDVGYTRDEILQGIRKAVSNSYNAAIKNIVGPYGNGHASECIVSALKQVVLDDRLLIKRFVDCPTSPDDSRRPVEAGSFSALTPRSP